MSSAIWSPSAVERAAASSRSSGAGPAVAAEDHVGLHGRLLGSSDMASTVRGRRAPRHRRDYLSSPGVTDLRAGRARPARDRGLAARPHVELAQDRRRRGGRRSAARAPGGRRSRRCAALRDQPQHLELARRQVRGIGARRRRGPRGTRRAERPQALAREPGSRAPRRAARTPSAPRRRRRRRSGLGQRPRRLVRAAARAPALGGGGRVARDLQAVRLGDPVRRRRRARRPRHCQ